MLPPVMPPKPRVKILGDCVVLDTGHADVLHDTWQEAMSHAERICRDYKARLVLWSLQGRDAQCDSICDGDGGRSSCFTPWCRCTVCHRTNHMDGRPNA